ncbi:MAG: nitroreductase family deazaflavin-dependent oxidoreductase [Propionibacteriales bacterium]|nr:nitroreductase family deazaflavin-dependent oxidoreductase [Propionibacteriales bacterium]
MTETASTFEDDLITHMRANDGVVTSGPLKGHPLLVMTSTGATSGEPRRSILTWSRDLDDYIVAGTADGSKRDPAWFANVRANLDVAIEAGNRTFDPNATVVAESDRVRLWDQYVAALPWFAAYPEQTGRDIPMVRISPINK